MVKPIVAALRRLVFGCWVGHGYRYRERRGGVYRHVCGRCGDDPELLPGQHGRVVKVCLTGRQELADGWRQAKIREFRRRA